MKDFFVKVIMGNVERNIKLEVLKEFLYDYYLVVNEIVYVGDVFLDIMECRKVNVMCLFVVWSIL